MKQAKYIVIGLILGVVLTLPVVSFAAGNWHKGDPVYAIDCGNWDCHWWPGIVTDTSNTPYPEQPITVEYKTTHGNKTNFFTGDKTDLVKRNATKCLK